MNRKTTEVLLAYMLDSIEKIEQALNGVSREDFLNFFTFHDIADRRLEIIGEAAISVPEEFKKDHPEIEWRDIADTRNKIIHEYFSVDHKLVWEIIQNDLPKLKKYIAKILDETKEQT